MGRRQNFWLAGILYCASVIIFVAYKQSGHDEIAKLTEEDSQTLEPEEDIEQFLGGTTMYDEPLDENDPNFPYRRMSPDNNNIYFVFNSEDVLYTNQDSTVGGLASKKLYPLERQMLNQMKEEAKNYLSEKLGFPISNITCPDVKYRMLPTLGLESQLVCTIAGEKQLEKVSLFQPFNQIKVTQHHTKDLSTKSLSSKFAHLNIIVPLEGRVSSFQIFLQDLGSVVNGADFLHSGLQLGLTIAYFEDASYKKIKNAYERFQKQNPQVATHFYTLPSKPGAFSRSKALKAGLSKSEIQADVIFVTDVDISLNFDFLKRCVSTPILGKQFYFPVMFSLYNPLFNRRKRSRVDRKKLSDMDGNWRLYSYGMVCGYRDDFLSLHAYYKKFTGWGKEDLYFFRKVSQNKNYKVIRSLDPGLLHRYHEKKCSSDVTPWTKECMHVKYSNEGSKISLARKYFS